VAPASRLAGETSPYLVAHQQDLVDWWPWGPEAFAEARTRDVPVFLVLGYATCHWCHVLATESFQDPALSAQINARFVPVLVDREERPDVDAAQLAAARALTGKGLGWPLMVLLSPEGEVLFATSYLPPHDGDRGVKVGLQTVLNDLSGRWSTDRQVLLDRGRALAADLAAPGGLPSMGDWPGLWREVDERLASRADRVDGGFTGAPKFPRSVTWDAWLSWSLRHGRPGGRDHVLFTLRTLATRPLHDPIDGGFHRYATDAAWREPHFEKTLTDNAQLGSSYLDARRADPDPLFPATAAELARFLGSFWASQGLASALDADSAGPDGTLVEGAYYVFDRRGLAAVLGAGPGEEAAVALGLEGEAGGAPGWVHPLPEPARLALVQLRQSRPPPLRDDKVVLGWQGLALSFLARAGRELPDPLAAKLALRLGTVLDEHLKAGVPSRTLGGSAPATLDDFAFLAEGMLELFLATNDERWLLRAEGCVRWADERLRKPDGGHWRGVQTDPPLPVRPVADEDGSEPSAAATLARTRLRIGALRGDDLARNRVTEDLTATATAITTRPASHTAWLRVADELAYPPPEVVLTWPPGADVGPMREALFASPAVNAVELVVSQAQLRALAPSLPLLEGKGEVDGPTAYVCTLGVCQAPARTPDALRGALRAAQAP
jgi:uncharacterized protein YyaL (SSP411 family)